MALFDPNTLKGQVEIFLRFSGVLTSVDDLDGLKTRILLITHDSDQLSIREVHNTLCERFSLKVSYHTVRNAVAALRRKELLSLKQELQMRGRPNLISIQPRGRHVIEAVLAQAQAMLGVIPHEARPIVKAAAERAVEILDQLECLRLLADQSGQQEGHLPNLTQLIKLRIIELCH
jgi:hypothetical protein